MISCVVGRTSTTFTLAMQCMAEELEAKGLRSPTSSGEHELERKFQDKSASDYLFDHNIPDIFRLKTLVMSSQATAPDAMTISLVA